MSAIPKYTSDENFRRIRMQKKLSFVVVEGSDDVPIYESCLGYMAADCENFDIVFSGGKVPIERFLESSKAANAIFIVDRDFDDFEIKDDRVVVLERYSVENYFICEKVISCSLQFVLGCKLKDAQDVFSLDEFIAEASDALGLLIKVLFYYQREVAVEKTGEARVAWSETFLCQAKSWHLCRDRIQELISELLPTPGLVAQAEEYYDNNFTVGGAVVENFPGKMLRHSLQRYIRHKLLELKPGANGKFNDVETARLMLCSSMHRSTDMAKVLTPVVDFLRNSNAVA